MKKNRTASKKLEIKIGTPEQMKEEILEIFDHPEKASEKAKRTVYLTPEQVPRILSTERLRLLQIVRNDDYTVSELADILGRKIENVSRDLRELEHIGFIEVKKHGRERYPAANRQIMITI